MFTLTITPIETRYAGCRFRSRLEARWAVFFDALDIKWDYEPQGYTVGPGKTPYLPDFLLPELNAFVEVKGEAERLDLEMLADLVRDSRIAPCLLILGPIPLLEPLKIPTHAMLMPVFDALRSKAVPLAVVNRAFAAVEGLADEDKAAVRELVTHSRRTAVVHQRFVFVAGSGGCGPYPLGPLNMTSTAADALDSKTVWHVVPIPRIRRAYEAARSARFEHGETGLAA